MVVLAASCILPDDLEALSCRIAAALQQAAERHTATGATPKIELSAVKFARVIDPASQQPGYEGVWRNARNDRCGTLTFNGDGSFYAEYDLFCPHPNDARWFVEMVTAWGNAETIRSEAKLIPAL
jgi:hypothetical protein